MIAFWKNTPHDLTASNVGIMKFRMSAYEIVLPGLHWWDNEPNMIQEILASLKDTLKLEASPFRA